MEIEKMRIRTIFSIFVLVLVLIIAISTLLQEDDESKPTIKSGKAVIKKVAKEKEVKKKVVLPKKVVEKRVELPKVVPEIKKEAKLDPKPKKKEIVSVVESFCSKIGIEADKIKLIRCRSEGNKHWLFYSIKTGAFETINNHFWKLKFQKELKNALVNCYFYYGKSKKFSYVFENRLKHYIEIITIW